MHQLPSHPRRHTHTHLTMKLRNFKSLVVTVYQNTHRYTLTPKNNITAVPLFDDFFFFLFAFSALSTRVFDEGIRDVFPLFFQFRRFHTLFGFESQIFVLQLVSKIMFFFLAPLFALKDKRQKTTTSTNQLLKRFHDRSMTGGKISTHTLTTSQLINKTIREGSFVPCRGRSRKRHQMNNCIDYLEITFAND